MAFTSSLTRSVMWAQVFYFCHAEPGIVLNLFLNVEQN